MPPQTYRRGEGRFKIQFYLLETHLLNHHDRASNWLIKDFLSNRCLLCVHYGQFTSCIAKYNLPFKIQWRLVDFGLIPKRKWLCRVSVCFPISMQ